MAARAAFRGRSPTATPRNHHNPEKPAEPGLLMADTASEEADAVEFLPETLSSFARNLIVDEVLARLAPIFE